jgi:hypothetical protein
MKGYRRSSRLPGWDVGVSLFLLIVLCLLMRSEVARAEPPNHTSAGAENQQPADAIGQLSPPSELRSGSSQQATQTASWPLAHLVVALLSGLLITAAGLRIKFRRFVGLGVFTNWYSALFLATGTLLCGLPQTSVSTLASHVTPPTASWIADTVGIFLTFLLGAGVRSPKASAGGSAIPESTGQSGSNVILAVIEDGIRDRIVTRMQSVVVEDAQRYSWGAIEHASQRVVDEEVAVGRLGRDDGEAAIHAVEGLRAPHDKQSDLDRKYRALLRLVSCCALSRLRKALAAAAGEYS